MRHATCLGQSATPIILWTSWAPWSATCPLASAEGIWIAARQVIP
jgi:hypothetical protein